MAINCYNLKKWTLMFTGKSPLHVNQDIGKVFSKDTITGYYNDLTEKVTIQPDLLTCDKVPTVKTEKGNEIVFPVAVFQYGLGAYDLFLLTKHEKYLKKFKQCVHWTLNNQCENGAWNNFFFYYPYHPYSAMAQGEGVSLLLRAFIHYNGDKKFIKASQKGIDYMLIPIEKGGTTEYNGNDVIFHEYTHREAVLNGWIFSIFGLYDYVECTHDNGKYRETLDKTILTLEKYIPQFSMSYWSRYDLHGRISSPFYHHLHIAQLKALYALTGKRIFKETEHHWRKQESNLFCKSYAILVKALQKIRE